MLGRNQGCGVSGTNDLISEAGHEDWRTYGRRRLSGAECGDPGGGSQGRASLQRRVCWICGGLAGTAGRQDAAAGLVDGGRNSAARGNDSADVADESGEVRGRLAALRAKSEEVWLRCAGGDWRRRYAVGR